MSESRAEGSPRSLFVYGTLTDSDFAADLLEHPIDKEPGRLLDFEILSIEGFGYATVFEAPGEVVEGIIFRGLTDEDLERLDSYEGVSEGLYSRVEATAVPESGGPEPCWVYVVTERTLKRYDAL